MIHFVVSSRAKCFRHPADLFLVSIQELGAIATMGLDHFYCAASITSPEPFLAPPPTFSPALQAIKCSCFFSYFFISSTLLRAYLHSITPLSPPPLLPTSSSTHAHHFVFSSDRTPVKRARFADPRLGPHVAPSQKDPAPRRRTEGWTGKGVKRR